MKKKVLITIASVITVLTIGIAGYKAGINHAIYSADIFVVELPDRNASGGFDEDEITVYLTVDGETHEYGCTIG